MANKLKHLLWLLLLAIPFSAGAQSSFIVPVTTTGGQAVIGASVALACVSGGCGTSSYSASTDNSGNAQFNSVIVGKYTVTVSGSGISTYSYTMTVDSPNPSSLNNIIFVDGVTYTTLALAVPACKNPGTIYLTPGTYPVSSNLTIPASCAIRFEGGAVVNIGNGVTLTINGSVVSGIYPIFSYTGTGVVKFGLTATVPAIYPEWWGAKRDGATSDRVAWQNTFAASQVTPGVSSLPMYCSANGSYFIDSPGLNFSGSNQYMILGPSQGTCVFQIQFTSANTVGMDLSAGQNGELRNVTVSCGTSAANAPTVCLLRARTSGSNAIENRITNSFIQGYSPWIYYNYRGEQEHIQDSSITELATTGTPLTLSVVNTAAITSPNVTFGGVASETQFSIDGGAMTIGSNATAAGSKDIYFDEGSSGSLGAISIRAFINQSGSNQTAIGDTSGASGTMAGVVININTNSSSNSNTTVSLAGNASIWDINGTNSNTSTTTQFTFANFRSSHLKYLTSQTSGSCFTATSALNSTLQLDPTDCSTYTAPGAASVSNVNGTSYGAAVAISSSAAPTISSGFGTSPTVEVSNGSSAIQINVGTGGTASSGIINMPFTATNSWNCTAYNKTAHAGNRADDTVVTALSTTQVTLQNQTKSTGAAVAWTASDRVMLHCDAE